MTSVLSRLCLVLLLAATTAHAWNRPEMSSYGAAYQGPEQLQVQVAHNKADNQAVIKIRGINHPLDGHVFWAKVTYQHRQGAGYPDRVLYTDESIKDEGKRAVLFIQGSSGTLYLPNFRNQLRVEIPVHYNWEASIEMLPEHILTDYERQIGAIK